MHLRRVDDDRMAELIEWYATRAHETAQRAPRLRLVQAREPQPLLRRSPKRAAG
jgi:hypothetical protein